MTNRYRTVDRFHDPAGATRVARFASILSRFPAGHLIDLGAGQGIFSHMTAEDAGRADPVSPVMRHRLGKLGRSA